MSACFESASLDTNILIHLWKSGTEAMLGKMFGKAYVYQWLIDVELRHHADAALMERIIEAMEDGFLEPVDDRALKEMGLWSAFREAYEDVSMFFSGPDTGEGYAIALAQAFGIPALVTEEETMEQMQQVNQAIESGAAAIVLLPVDGLAIVPAVQKANRAKIPVIATNRDLDGGEFAQVMSDEKQAGILQGEYMAKHLP